ncbi:hypothetical protein [Amphritea pacifica]|uniref:DUF454 family protein n=1 Tax=Amphritea pacifica TaxID=2811233 RepID=A0ABS2W341_9GAMM|nr:hypothetical protein [Amphritea pacifica]MBN0986124.1 hypothetical protein [Amphritea pacifica]MBN1007530.1 hypothetical protein [Amphritea pacifica]
MGFELIWFYLRLMLPEWMHVTHPDSSHFFRRKFTSAYKARLRWVYRIWIGSGLLMLAIPAPPVVIGLGLFTTFISFSLLDEAE